MVTVQFWSLFALRFRFYLFTFFGVDWMALYKRAFAFAFASASASASKPLLTNANCCSLLPSTSSSTRHVSQAVNSNVKRAFLVDTLALVIIIFLLFHFIIIIIIICLDFGCWNHFISLGTEFRGQWSPFQTSRGDYFRNH